MPVCATNQKSAEFLSQYTYVYLFVKHGRIFRRTHICHKEFGVLLQFLNFILATFFPLPATTCVPPFCVTLIICIPTITHTHIPSTYPHTYVPGSTCACSRANCWRCCNIFATFMFSFISSLSALFSLKPLFLFLYLQLFASHYICCCCCCLWHVVHLI